MCNKEKFWAALCDALGHAEWKDDPRFRTFTERLEHRDEITRILDQALSERSTEQWLEILSGTVPVAPVNDIAQALDNPFVAEEGRLQSLTHPTDGTYRMVANPVRSSEGETPSQPAPGLGQHTNDLLDELGYSKERIDGLRDKSII